MKIVAVSDQHGFTPHIPECDLLIVAGDQCVDKVGGAYARGCPTAQMDWFVDNWLPWRERQPAELCLMTWGNHDFCGHLQQENVVTIGDRQTTAVIDAEVTVNGLRVWMMPWSHTWATWAFQKDPRRLQAHYDAIPEGIDIIVSHGPPYGYGDLAVDLEHGGWVHAGEPGLVDAIDRVKPRLVVCGHIHTGHGQFQRDGTTILNAAVVAGSTRTTAYELAHEPTVWEF